jgi:hypothetical protein
MATARVRQDTDTRVAAGTALTKQWIMEGVSWKMLVQLLVPLPQTARVMLSRTHVQLPYMAKTTQMSDLRCHCG